MRTCRSCGAAVLWAVTVHGNAMPLNASPDPTGNVVLTGRKIRTKAGGQMPECHVYGYLFDDDDDRYMPHHATCPQAEQWRRD